MSDTTVKRRLVRDLSASTVQTGIIQVFGLLFFYLSSRFLSKEDFGEFSWSSAVAATMVAIASLGLDLIFVKRLASGKDVLQTSGIHLMHTLFSGILVSIGVWLASLFFETFLAAHPLLVIVTIYLSFSNIANSFKLCLNGLEAYKMLAQLAFISNVSKFVILGLLLLFGKFTVQNFVVAYFFGAIVEFVVGYALVKKVVGLSPKLVWQRDDYKAFIYESIPQMGVVLFDSALARIDWILLGVLSVSAAGITNAMATAEYSFAYKVFELSKLPLMIIAPVLLTRLARNLKNGELNGAQKKELEFFFRTEIFIVMLIPVFLTAAWSGLIDYFTNGKYGEVNYYNYILLALCVPLSAFINFYWTIGFVAGQLKKIMLITIVTALLNVALNAVLIQRLGTLGASLSFFISTVVQLLFYRFSVAQKIIHIRFMSVFLPIAFAVLSVVTATVLGINSIFSGLLALLIYVGLSLLTKLIKPSEFTVLKGKTNEN